MLADLRQPLLRILLIADCCESSRVQVRFGRPVSIPTPSVPYFTLSSADLKNPAKRPPIALLACPTHRHNP